MMPMLLTPTDLTPASSVAVKIWPVLAEQHRFPHFKRSREHLSMSPNLRARLGLSLNRQVMVTLSTGQQRLMTVETDHSERDQTVVRMDLAALVEFAGAGTMLEYPLTATISTDLFEASQAAAESSGMVYTESVTYGDGASVFINAIHGGDIESGTAEQALRCASRLHTVHGRGSRVLLVYGYPLGDQTAHDRFHITSVDVGDSYPIPASSYLAPVGIGFHGFVASAGEADLLLGGLAGSTERIALAAALNAATGLSTSTSASDELDGDAAANVTNRFATETYQLEGVYASRSTYRDVVADTVADFLDSRLP